MVDLCESPPEFITPTDDVTIDWDEPLFHDNSREELTIRQSHAFGRFPFGTTAVTYTASDSSGNTATCNISITLQSRQILCVTFMGIYCISSKIRTLDILALCQLSYKGAKDRTFRPAILSPKT